LKAFDGLLDGPNVAIPSRLEFRIWSDLTGNFCIDFLTRLCGLVTAKTVNNLKEIIKQLLLLIIIILLHCGGLIWHDELTWRLQ